MFNSTSTYFRKCLILLTFSTIIFCIQFLAIIQYGPDSLKKPFQKCVNDKEELLLLIGVMSSPDNFDRRAFIRATWGNSVYYENIGVKVVFVIGRKIGIGSKNIQNEIEKEKQYYGDIIQEDFVDSYRNLTLKTLSLLKLATDCPRKAVVLKVDDDVFLHPFKLAKNVKRITKNGIANSFLCLLNKGGASAVIRKKSSKWYVSEAEYPGVKFPTFCSGPAYLITGDLIPKLYHASLTEPLFFLEDVYTTGILGKKVGAILKDYDNSWFIRDYTSRDFENYKLKLVNDTLVFLHPSHITDIQKKELWYAILQ